MYEKLYMILMIYIMKLNRLKNLISVFVEIEKTVFKEEIGENMKQKELIKIIENTVRKQLKENKGFEIMHWYKSIPENYQEAFWEMIIDYLEVPIEKLKIIWEDR